MISLSTVVLVAIGIWPSTARPLPSFDILQLYFYIGPFYFARLPLGYGFLL